MAIRAVSTVSKASGLRIARFLPEILPKLETSCRANETTEDGEVTDDICELKSSCLDAIAAFLLSIPNEVGAYRNMIIDLFLDYTRYNPADEGFGDFADDGGDDDADDDWGDDNDDDGEWGDDEGSNGFGGCEDNVASDRSFQVRKSAILGLTNLFNTRPDLLKEVAPKCASILLECFTSETEASTRVALLECMGALVKICLVTDDTDKKHAPTRARLVRQNSGSVLLDLVPNIIQAALDLLKTVSEAEAIFRLMDQVTNLSFGPGQDGLGAMLKPLVTDTTQALTGDRFKGNNNACVAALELIHTIILSHNNNPKLLVPHAEDLVKAILQGLRSKTISNAVIANACAASFANGMAGQIDVSIIKDIFTTSVEMTGSKYDGAKRKAACTTIASILCTFGDELKAEDAVAMLSSALGHGETRVVTMRGLQMLSQGNPKLLTAQGPKFSKLLQNFIGVRKDRALRLLALQTLNSLLSVSTVSFSDFTTLGICIRDRDNPGKPDVPLAAAALQLSTNLLKRSSECLKLIKSHIVPRVMELSVMGSFESNSLKAMTAFLQQILTSDPSLAADLRKQFAIQPDGADAKTKSEAGLKDIALRGSCLAALSTRGDIDHITTGIKSSSVYVRCLSLTAIGAMGAIIDPVKDQNVVQLLSAAVQDSSVSVVNRFAANAYGTLAASNLEFYLKKFQTEIQGKCDGAAAITVLGQMINFSDRTSLGSHVKELLPTLLQNSGETDESVRRMVGQALGRLAAQDPDGVLPTLRLQLKESHWSKAAAISSLQVAAQSVGVRQVIMEEISNFLDVGFTAVDDEKASAEERVAVADAIVSTLSSLYQKFLVDVAPILRHGSVRNQWPHLLPLLKRVDAWRQTIDLGAFKKLVDRGVVIRIKVLELILMVLAKKPLWFHGESFYPLVTQLLEDEENGIKVLTLKILCKLCSTDPGALVTHFKSFGERLRKTALRSRRQGKDAAENSEDYQLFYWSNGTMKTIGEIVGIERNADFAKQNGKVRKEKLCVEMMGKFVF